MNQDSKYIAAIEISSSKITGAVARLAPAGQLYVIAVESEPALECVRHGMVHNVEETAEGIAKIVARLQSRTGVAPRTIQAIYMGLNGRSLRNVPREVYRNLPDDSEITSEILSAINDDARRSQIDSSLEVIEAIPSHYLVNKTETKNPIGTFGSNIRVGYQLLAARPQLRRHLLRVVQDKAGIPVAATVITPLAVGDLILSEDERRLGCMLVDMGAETTTVAIWRGGGLQYLAVLPMGGRNITLDITSLSVLEHNAEQMKIKSGDAITPENPVAININGTRTNEMQNLVAARANEIVANIIEQINYAGLTAQQLPAGIVVVGGGFNLKRMDELLRRRSGLTLRRGKLPPSIVLEDTKAPTFETIQVISVLEAGYRKNPQECLALNSVTPLPDDDPDYTDPDDEAQEDDGPSPRRRPKGGGFIGRGINRLRTAVGGMFNSGDDDDDPEID